MSGGNWVFGLGFTIEKAENAFPKHNLVVPITAAFNDNEITLPSPISAMPSRLETDQPTDAELDAFVEDLLNGLENVVERWARGEPRSGKIGFRTVTE